MPQFDFSRGWVQRANRNSYQPGELLDATNVANDPEGGGVATRLGDSVTATVPGGRVYALYQTYTAEGAPVQYQAAGGALFRNAGPIQTGLNTAPISFASMAGFSERHVYTFFANGQEALRYKDDGTLYSNWGLKPPSTAPSVGSSVSGGDLNGNYSWRQIYVRKPIIPGGVFGRWIDSPPSFTLTGTYPFLLSNAVGNGMVLGAPEPWDAVRFVIVPTPPTTSDGGSFEFAYWNGEDWMVYGTVPWGLYGAYLAEQRINFPVTSWQIRDGYYLVRIRMLVAPTTIATFSDLTFYDSVYAARSNPSPPCIVTGPYGIGLGTAYVNVANPLVPPDNEIQATHIAIYRTTGDDPALSGPTPLGVAYAQFFFERDVPAGTPFYASSLADTTLGELLELDNERPPVFDTIATYQNRLFGAKAARLYFSKAGFPESFPGTNYLDVGTPADPIRRIGEFHGSLYIWTTAAVYLLLGTDETSYDTRLVQCPVGLGAIDSVADGERAIYFLGSDGHLWGLQGTIAANMSRIGHQQLFEGVTLHGVEGMHTAALSACVGHWGKGRYYLAYPTLTATQPTTSLMIDEARGSWWRDTRAWQALYHDHRSNTFYGGLADGTVVRFDSGTTDHGTAIVGRVQTLDDMAGTPDSDKDLSQLVVESVSPNGLTVTPVVSYVVAADALGTVTTLLSSQRILPSPAPGTYRGTSLGYVLTGTAPWALSGLMAHILRLPVRSRVWQSLPTTLNWPGTKILESILLDVDVVSGALTWTLLADSVPVETGTITRLGRQVPQLLHMRHEATVFSLRLDGTGVFYVYDGSVMSGRPLPPAIYNHIWTPSDLGTEQDKIGLSYVMDVDMLAAGTMTIEFYADGALKHTLHFTSVGRQRTERFRLPSSMTGRLMEIRTQSTAPYRLWNGTDYEYQSVGSPQSQHYRPVQEPYGQSQQVALMQMPHTEEI